jgi:hypothetical protein
MKKNILLTLLLWVTICEVSFSQPVMETKSVKFQVGSQPVAIFPTRQAGSFDINPNELNIICYGVDVNYNSIFEEGDELPSWWRIENADAANPFESNQSQVVVSKVMDFNMSARGSMFPYRTRITEKIDKVPALQSNLLPISYPTKVVFYDIATAEKKDSIVVDVKANFSSICRYSDFIFSTTREHDEEWKSTNVISMYKKTDDFSKVISYTSPNVNIQRVIAFENDVEGTTKVTIAVLYENVWSLAGTPGTLEFHTLKDGIELSAITADMAWEDCFDIKTIEVGVGINDMVLLSPNGLPFIFVISSGDNRIYTVDCSTQEADGTEIGIDLGYIQISDIPVSIREMSLFQTEQQISALVTSYSGFVYYIDDIIHPDEGDGIRKIAVESGLIEGSSLLNNFNTDGLQAAYTIMYSDESYTAGNEVALLFQNETSIYETLYSLKLFPNPVSNIVNIELKEEDVSEINSIKFINNEGKHIEVHDYSINGNHIQIDVPSLQAGIYFVELNIQNKLHLQKVIIK